MQLQSLNSAGARFLDRDAVLLSLRRKSEQLVLAQPQVEGIALFGSLARGDYSRRSDADVLACLRSAGEERMADRIPPLLTAFLDAPIPVDVLSLAAGEICRHMEDPNPFWIRIRREAILHAGTLPRFPQTANIR